MATMAEAFQALRRDTAALREERASWGPEGADGTTLGGPPRASPPQAPAGPEMGPKAQGPAGPVGP
eukprot:1201112-Lingulodinium_polyedra.AAC.1